MSIDTRGLRNDYKVCENIDLNVYKRKWHTVHIPSLLKGILLSLAKHYACKTKTKE